MLPLTQEADEQRGGDTVAGTTGATHLPSLGRRLGAICPSKEVVQQGERQPPYRVVGLCVAYRGVVSRLIVLVRTRIRRLDIDDRLFLIKN